AGSAVNTQLPVYAQIGGTPAEQAILNRILGIGTSAGVTDATDPAAYLSAENVRQYLAGLPAEQRADIEREAARVGLPATEWLARNVRETGNAAIREGLVNQARANIATAAQVGAVPPEIQALQRQATSTAGTIFGDVFDEDAYFAGDP